MTARRNGMWWRAVLIIAGLLAITGLSAVASPASATVRNWQLVSESSDSNASDAKGVRVTCPDDTQRLAAGADVVGEGSDTVVIGAVKPEPQSVTAFAYEALNGTKKPWALRAWAVCGNVGSTVSTSSMPSDHDSTAYKEATASCPSPMVVLGTGFEVHDALGSAIVHTVTPTENSVTVKAYVVDSHRSVWGWSVTAHAICADDPGGRSQVSYTTILNNSDTPKLGAAACPWGTRGFGGGFKLNGFQGRLNINKFIPSSPGVVTLGSELIATTNDWTITTYTICMPADLP